MDFSTILPLVAPLAVVLITQGLKALINMGGKYAVLVVIVLGAGTAILQQGLAPDPAWVDGLVTTGWVSGLATLFYDFFKKMILKQ